MEDWQRLSSMMLIDNFWGEVRGEKALVFQPDSAMCAGSSAKSPTTCSTTTWARRWRGHGG